MGASTCRSCCSDQRVEAVPHLPEIASREDGMPVWEEVLNDAKLSSKLWDASVNIVNGIESTGNLRMEFEFRGQKEIGVQLQLLPEPEPALIVSGVDAEGDLSRTIDGGAGVCPGDAILEASGHRGNPAAIFEALQSFCGQPQRASISVRPRPRSFPVDLVREGKSWHRLGLKVALKPDTGFVMVAAVQEVGLAPEWNLRHNQHCICAGDRILSVNGRRGSAIAMYSVVQATNLGGMIRLEVEPPPRHLVPVIAAWAQNAIQSGGDGLETL